MSITTSIHRPRASKEGVILILGSSLSIMGSVMIATVMPKIAAEFGITTPGANILIPLTITGPALAMAVCSPMVGWPTDVVAKICLFLPRYCMPLPACCLHC